MLRHISKAIFPTLEKDLSASLSKQVSVMEDLMLMAPRVFSYQHKTSGSATVGAFGRTVSRQTQKEVKGDAGLFVKVERKVVPRGLFHD
mmetsp:Transcript_1260/g.1923  ORF Transcript_1260/g.1923 Transcript_1260/m.1923 type:complete len:89 (-) Transcript_1260:160-426(-)